MKIFTDGSCLGNPGPGGYCIIIHNKEKNFIISYGYYLTTNNRMELMAVVKALEILNNKYIIEIVLDSRYVYCGITRWMSLWKSNNWKLKNKKLIKNIDLWIRLDKVLRSHVVNLKLIKSHCGNLENDKCDKIARISANNPKFQDIMYMKENLKAYKFY